MKDAKAGVWVIQLYASRLGMSLLVIPEISSAHMVTGGGGGDGGRMGLLETEKPPLKTSSETAKPQEILSKSGNRNKGPH